MKYILLIIYILLSPALRAQTTIEEWGAAVDRFGRSLPQEKVYLHTDNQCYFLGDTIFYRAYLTRSDTRKLSTLSGVLYVELLNADGYLMERQQIPMKYGMGTGSVVLDTARCQYAGYYELRAYTRWQLNWGASTYKHTKWSERWFFNKSMARDFYRDYDKLYSRVLPVYDHPLAPGDYTRDMTERPLQRYFKSGDTGAKASITLYPEGGYIVEGVTGRIAFDALNDEGRHLRGKLQITDSHGNIVTEGKTRNRGRGTVTFTPQPDTKYHCTFTDGETQYKVSIPKIEAAGVALKADINDSRLDITVSPKGLNSEETLGMTIMSSGVVDTVINLTQNGMHHSLPIASLPVGVIDVTIFNNEGRVYADRLLFNSGDNNFAAPHTIAIDGADATVEAYKPVTLTLRSCAKRSGVVSMAVMDAATTDDVYDNASLLTEMLLSSEIRGFVEDPGYYFEAVDDEHRSALDLLMMVQGWRRFDWRTMAVPKEEGFSMLHPYEKTTPILTGQVHRYQVEMEADIFRDQALAAAEEYMDGALEPTDPEELANAGTSYDSGLEELQQMVEANSARYHQDAENANERFDKRRTNLKREVLVHAEFSQPGSEALVGEMATEKGRFKIELPQFDGECYFFLAASDSTKWRSNTHQWVKVDRDLVERRDVPEFYVYLEKPYPRFAHPYTYYQTASAEGHNKVRANSTGRFDDRQLEEVTVRVKHGGKRHFDKRYPAIKVDALEAFNHTIDAGLNTGQYLGYMRFANDVARAYIGDMGLERQYLLQMRWDGHNSTSNLSDGVKNSYNDIARLDYVNIYTDYSPRRMGDKRWLGSDQPEVIVDVHLMPNDGRRVTYRDRRMILPGFSVVEDFYHPDYSRMALPEKPDVRRTLYWNPSLRLDDNGEATVTFYRNARAGDVIVTVNGFSTDGSVICGEAR